MKKLYLAFLIACVVSCEAQTGKLVKQIPTSLPVSCIQVSPNHALIAIGDDTEDPLGFKELKESFKVTLIKASDYSKVVELVGHQESIESVDFSGDSRKLVSADKKGNIVIWDISTGKQITKIETGEWVHDAKFSISGNEIIAIQGFDKIAIIYSLEGGLIATLQVENQINDFEVNQKTNELYFGCYDEIQIWSIVSRKKIKSRKFEGLMCMRFNHDYSQIAIGTREDIVILDTELKEKKRLSGHFKPILSVSFSFDDTKIASASSDQTARIWDLGKASEIVQLINEHKGTVQAIEYVSPKNHFLTGGENKEVKIWK